MPNDQTAPKEPLKDPKITSVTGLLCGVLLVCMPVLSKFLPGIEILGVFVLIILLPSSLLFSIAGIISSIRAKRYRFLFISVVGLLLGLKLIFDYILLLRLM